MSMYLENDTAPTILRYFYLCKAFDMYKYFKQECEHNVAIIKELSG